MRKLLAVTVGAIALLASSAAGAQTQINPTGYVAFADFRYPDSTGNELTDGFIADRHFSSYSAPTGAPYLGFDSFNPTIVFTFGRQQTFGSLVMWVDDFGGIAGVTAPASLSAVVNGITYSNFTVGTPLDTGFSYLPFNYPAGGGTPYRLNLTGAVGDTVDLTVNRGGQWTFLSEVQFFAPAISAAPEPATWVMMILGFGLIGGALRRDKRVSLALARR